MHREKRTINFHRYVYLEWRERVMARIFGTILSIGEFFKKDNTEVKIERGGETEQVFSLLANRKYIIPDYQREIRWKKKHLIELISDISDNVKFLGNIILNKRSALEYEVIDGQQRITALLMIISYIRNRFHEEFDVFETCKLEMVNFDKFDLLITNNFNLDSLGRENKILVENSDIFNQRERYIELWSVFAQIDKLQTATNCANFLTNIKRSQINLIVNTEDNDNYSIGYFMDVNLKGVRLDNEDIFKGYLFNYDTGQDIRHEWNLFKIQSFKLNLESDRQKKTEYPTTKLLEHYLYCDLYKNARYRNIQFREDFTITELMNLDGNQHYKGEHIIKVIRNNTYMLQGLKNINKFLTIILDVVTSRLPSQSFKELFNSSAEIDDVEAVIIHNFLKKIMLDKNIVPRILIMKYVIEVLFDKTNKTKADYRKIYGLYLLAVMFTIFESEKDITKVLGVVKDSEWYTKAAEQSKSYFARSKVSRTKITVQYKLINAEDTENYMLRCKSLATIYNFFEIIDGTVKVINGKMNDLNVYVTDSNRFSNEHFIINERGVFNISGNSCNYPSDIKKYANSIFNFIFISKQLNEEDLGNNILSEKIRILDEKVAVSPTIIECEFSKMIIERCRTVFSCPISLPIANTDEAAQMMGSYYQNEFIEQFSAYAIQVINKIGEKMGVN